MPTYSPHSRTGLTATLIALALLLGACGVCAKVTRERDARIRDELALAGTGGRVSVIAARHMAVSIGDDALRILVAAATEADPFPERSTQFALGVELLGSRGAVALAADPVLEDIRLVADGAGYNAVIDLAVNLRVRVDVPRFDRRWSVEAFAAASSVLRRNPDNEREVVLDLRESEIVALDVNFGDLDTGVPEEILPIVQPLLRRLVSDSVAAAAPGPVVLSLSDFEVADTQIPTRIHRVRASPDQSALQLEVATGLRPQSEEPSLPDADGDTFVTRVDPGLVESAIRFVLTRRWLGGRFDETGKQVVDGDFDVTLNHIEHAADAIYVHYDIWRTRRPCCASRLTYRFDLEVAGGALVARRLSCTLDTTTGDADLDEAAWADSDAGLVAKRAIETVYGFRALTAAANRGLRINTTELSTRDRVVTARGTLRAANRTMF